MTLTRKQTGNHRIYDGLYSYINDKVGGKLHDHQNDPIQRANQARNPGFASNKIWLKRSLPETDEASAPVSRFDGNEQSSKG